MNGIPHSATEAEAFLAAHPEVDAIQLLFTDLNGIQRGKTVRRHELAPIYAQGRYLPCTIFGLDLLGHDVDAAGLAWENGDADKLCLPVPGTLVPMPWAPVPSAQALISLYELDGTPVAGDPRHALVRAVERLQALGYTPVVAAELEFYLLDAESVRAGRPRPYTGEAGCSDNTRVYELAPLDELAPLLAELHAAADAQGIPSETTISEFAPGQFEITLHHRADALRAVDEAVMWKRLVRGVAAKHGLVATFMAKPFGATSGSGLHIHTSLNDAAGHNVFAAEDPAGTPLLRHAVGGMMATMAEAMAVFAPNANSYRRFRANSYAPVAASWGINNRTVSLRVPVGPAPSRHVEHRVAGADANLYLAFAAVLTAIHKGLTERLDPGEPLVGNGYAQGGLPLPIHWPDALERAERSAFLREALGEGLLALFCATKRQEWEKFNAIVSDVDYQWYLRTA